MTIANRLVALSKKEFEHSRASPGRQKFRGMKLDVGKFDESWARRREHAIKLMAVVLRDDDKALLDRIGASEQTVKAYGDAVGWFHREAGVLRKTANMLDLASSRLTTVIERYQERVSGQVTN